MFNSKKKIVMVILAVFAVMSAFCAPAFCLDQITIDLPAVDVTVTKDDDGYAKFSFTDDRIQFITKTGEPAIPYLVVKALLPPGADLSTVNVEIEREAVTSDAVAAQSGETWQVKPTPPPSTWDGTKVITLDEEPEENPYATSIRFPYSIVGNISTGTIWDKWIGEWQIIDIPVALFHYNPVTKGLFTLNSTQAVVTFEHKPMGRSTPSIPEISSPSKIEQRLRKSVVNFDKIAPEYRTLSKARSASQEKRGYVIITTSSIVNTSNQLDNFVQHKQNRGFNVHVMTENIWGGGTGDTAAENIREWLKDNYVNLSIEYVLLIGNPNPSTGDVPMKMLCPNSHNIYPEYRNSPSDYYYADLTGNWDLDGDDQFGEDPDDFGAGGIDRNYEVIVGRIPYYGNISDLDSILSKIISYQNETNQEWRKKVLLPMEPSDDETPGYHLGEEIKNSVIIPKGWTYSRVYEENYGLSPVPEKTPCTVENVTDAWKSSQFGAVFWWTHGWEQGASDIMDLAHVDMLDNTHPGFTFQCSCTNSHPETSNNLSYSLLKNGAIATVGATRVSWYGGNEFAGRSTNSGMTYEYAKRLIGNEMQSCGYALHDMKQSLIPGIWMNFTVFCLYGDPEVALMTSVTTDEPPVISDIPDQTTKRDIAITVPFTVSDDKTPAESLTVSATSSNTSLVPNSSLVFGGSGSERNLIITPAKNMTGSATITIAVNDGKNTATKIFSLSTEQFAEWHWEYPNYLGKGQDLNGVWGSSKNDIFFVGDNGIILHYDGVSYSEMISGTSMNLYGIWGTSGKDVFVVGDKGTILHYDGNSWAKMESGVIAQLNDIWGNSENDIFTVGTGVILRYNGSTWVEMISGIDSSYYLKSVWGSSNSNVFAVGWITINSISYGTILHYDGNDWKAMQNIPTGRFFSSIWSSSANNFFVSGGDGVFHYDGSKWTHQSEAIYADIWGNSSNDVYAMSGNGNIYHYDGNQWTEIADFYTINKPKITHFSSIWSLSINNVYVVFDDGGILHYDGIKWTEISKKIGDGFEDIWVNSNNVFAVGNSGIIYHYNGNEWTEMASGTSEDLFSIWGNSSTDIFAVGRNGVVLHYDGIQWSEVLKFTTNYLHDIWSSSKDNVFIVESDQGSILHYDGVKWTQMITISPNYFLGIWGSSGNDIFAVGSNGIIYHYNGKEWTHMPSPTSNYLSKVWGTSGNNVFAVGGEGTILHYDGNNWTPMISGVSSWFNGVWGSSENDVFAVGDNVILHYTPPNNNPILLTTPDTQTLPSIAGTSTINITNSGTGTLTWTAAENETWFSVSPASGTNTGTLTITYNANPGDTRTGSITITAPGSANSPKTVYITQSSKQAHFTPVWTGNPYNRMNFWIVGASIDGVPLSAGDEIAVFDGTKCVGSAIVSKEISYENMITLITSQDDGAGNGFTKGDSITFKIWDTSAGIEKTGITANFKDITTGNPITAPTFEPNGDYGVSLEIGGGQQSIALNSGWNIMSSYISPENTDMLALVQPLINSGCLEKVISESGGTIIKVFGTWKNTIGNYNPQEGYKVKLKCDSQLPFKGVSMQAGGNMYATSQSISLSAGWNIISYPYSTSQNAMTAVQSLIDSGSLVKVIDEKGGTIIKVFGTWKNNIGDFKPGEGYEIKVNTDATLMLKENSGSRSQDAGRISLFSFLNSHFSPVWTGNPYNPMNLWVAGITGYATENGDEIGIFDGDKCVGSAVVNGAISQENPLQIIASQDDGDGKGFTESHAITLKYWNSGNQTEITAALNFTDINGNQIATPVFTGKADYGATLTLSGAAEFTLNDAITALKILVGINVSPANTNADADKNGKIEMKDAVYILQKLAGIR